MSSTPPLGVQSIRSLALVGQTAAGKTSLTEALLHRAGRIGATGSVERGTTVCDFDPLENRYQHSLNSALAHLQHRDTRIHLVDTPGAPDFLGQSMTALAAVETAAVVVNAQNGIEMITARMMDWAAKRNLCRMIIVNKIDAEQVDLPARAGEPPGGLRQGMPADQSAGGRRHEGRRLLLQSGGRSGFLLRRGRAPRAGRPGGRGRPRARRALPEQGDVDPAELHAPFEQALREGHLIPVCFVSARNGAGVAELLDIFVKLMPNPTEGNPPAVPEGRRRRREADARRAGPVEARARPRLQGHDRSVRRQGRRVPRAPGHDHEGQPALHRRRPQAVQGGPPLPAAGQGHRRGADALVPGDIGAVAKVDEIHFDAVLHDFARRGPHPSRCRSSSRRRCTASPSSPSAAATSSGSRKRCTSSPPRTRRSRSSTSPRPTRPSSAASATCTCATSSTAWRGQYHVEVDDASRRASPTARRSRPRRKAITATRSRPAARASSARCSCASSR